MKKIIILFAAFSTLLFGCQKIGIEHLHDNCEITSIDITNFEFPVLQRVTGQINQETGEILFPTPKALKSQFNINKLKITANIGYDAKIDPPLTGIKDLSGEGLKVTVTATMTGRTKEYILKAYYSRN